jgi:hypothetical protein
MLGNWLTSIANKIKKWSLWGWQLFYGLCGVHVMIWCLRKTFQVVYAGHF